MKPLVIRPFIVARALARLREQKTHTLFAGYLHLQQRAADLRRLQDLRPEFLQFYKQFFEVANHPLGKPYIKIFTEQHASARNLWLNENVAGSYTPSSLRPNHPFRKIVHIEGCEYSLAEDHVTLAKKHLLYNQPIQVADLAAVLYRDYGFLKEPFSIEELINVFAYEFGYTNHPNGPPNQNFNFLFTLENVSQCNKDWLEKS